MISCLTVHDSDSSTASPLTPKPQNGHIGLQSSRLAKSLAVVAPTVKTQPVESSISAKIPPALGLPQNYYMKPKRAAATRHQSSSGGSISEHQQEPSRSQPLNLSQTTVSSSQAPPPGVIPSSSSLRRQHTYPPASSHYCLQEAPSFTSTPSLYTYPNPASHMEHLLVQGSSPSIHAPPTTHYAASLIPKDSIGGVVHGISAHYQQHYPAHPYTSTTRESGGGGAYSGYQLSPRRVPQYPYI